MSGFLTVWVFVFIVVMVVYLRLCLMGDFVLECKPCDVNMMFDGVSKDKKTAFFKCPLCEQEKQISHQWCRYYWDDDVKLNYAGVYDG